MNSLTSIVVHLDAGPRSANRLALARTLASRHDASVEALYAVESAFMTMPFAVEGANFGAYATQFDADRRRRALEQFELAMNKPGAAAAWSELRSDPVIPGIAQRAWYADLMILGQHEPASPAARDLPADFVESVITSSGKPALIVPYASAANTVAERILVAWRATRESARALEAAFPLLRHAQRVDVVGWEDAQAPTSTEDHARLARFLDLHRIQASFHWNPDAGGNTGDALLSQASDFDSDLIVMGCYGHSRARELVLGGATRTVLKSMTVPVLMAH